MVLLRRDVLKEFKANKLSKGISNMKVLTEMDSEGNTIEFFVNGEVYLKLKRENSSRLIGQLKRDREFFKHSKDIYRKTKSFGFCEIALKILKPRTLRVSYHGDDIPRGQYTINMKTVAQTKHYRFYKDAGFELQCFVPVDMFTLNTAKG